MKTKSKEDIIFRMNIIKKYNKCCQGFGVELLYPVGRNLRWDSHYGSLEVPQKLIKRAIMRSSNHSFEFMSKGDKTRMSRRYLQSHVNCHIVHNNQDRKIAQCPWADKSMKKCDKSMEKKEGNTVICSNMNEVKGHW